jgi:hypothetical protein
VVAGRKIEKGNSDPDVTITTSQIDTTDPTVWTIQSGFDEGFINFVFKLSDNIVKVPKIFLDSILSFDASVPGGSATNNNVPDIFPNLFNPLSLSGLKPNRLTYNLRTSISISRPVSESQWDNDFASLSTIPGQYYVQEWNTIPQIGNVSGVTYGNGNPLFIGSVINDINARWCQIQVRLTNLRTV